MKTCGQSTYQRKKTVEGLYIVLAGGLLSAKDLQNIFCLQRTRERSSVYKKHLKARLSTEGRWKASEGVFYTTDLWNIFQLQQACGVESVPLRILKMKTKFFKISNAR